MSSNRIQDWIRYVSDQTETAPPEKGESSEHPVSGASAGGSNTGGTNTNEANTAPPQASSRSDSSRQTQERILRERRAREYLNTARAINSRTGESLVGGPSIQESRQEPRVPATSGAGRAVGPQNAGSGTREDEARGSEARGGQARVERRAFDREVLARETGQLLDAATETVENSETSGEAKRVQKRVRSKPETRAQLLDRLLNPTISLHEASIILDVCTATVRRYTDSGLLPHLRTEGGQRRFRLRDVLILSREINKKGRA